MYDFSISFISISQRLFVLFSFKLLLAQDISLTITRLFFLTKKFVSIPLCHIQLYAVLSSFAIGKKIIIVFSIGCKICLMISEQIQESKKTRGKRRSGDTKMYSETHTNIECLNLHRGITTSHPRCITAVKSGN